MLNIVVCQEKSPHYAGLVLGGVSSFVDFYNTAKVSGLTFRDADGNILTNYTMTTGAGHDYSAVPVSPTAWLLGSALIGLFGFRRKFSK